ncbi:LytTR family DNA-binding domain-containing protein [Holzapfeliella sp. He02]|uniref:LytTR family DNA-binding domain-containing protein n=1 Tax=Holzapfeliella saturejae TaxID=3082953 RepID=A0ABU8SJ77_9LACO
MEMKALFKRKENMTGNTIVLQAKEQSDIVSDTINYIESYQQFITGKLNHQNYQLLISDFDSFYSNQKKVFGLINQKSFQLSSRLYELENNLPNQFMRISNTEIINLSKIKKFKLTTAGLIEIQLENGYSTSSSRRFLKKVKERLL